MSVKNHRKNTFSTFRGFNIYSKITNRNRTWSHMVGIGTIIVTWSIQTLHTITKRFYRCMAHIYGFRHHFCKGTKIHTFHPCWPKMKLLTNSLGWMIRNYSTNNLPWTRDGWNGRQKAKLLFQNLVSLFFLFVFLAGCCFWQVVACLSNQKIPTF